MNLEKLSLPPPILKMAARLLRAIEGAETPHQARVATARADGFVLGLETAQVLSAEAIKMLYASFEAADERRRDDEFRAPDTSGV